MTSGSFHLERFVDAQESVIAQVRREIHRGRKTSHWMWFIFPQLAGLGCSHMATVYGISGLPEAEAYLKHPVLGPRLEDCTTLMLNHSEIHITNILGTPDDFKFRSCMTLFSLVSDDRSVFHDAIRDFFKGTRDPKTLMLLEK